MELDTLIENETQEPLQDAVEVPASLTDAPVYTQEHTVACDSRVTVHGAIFAVHDSLYHWKMTNPHGEEIPLLNPTTAEPSFLPTETGDYTLELPTDDGPVRMLFHVVQP